MSENFFANYKKFVVPPSKQQRVGDEEFKPKDYATYYILTVSLYDSLLRNWIDAFEYEIDIRKSIEKVISDFNEKQNGKYHLQLLEFDEEKSYFVIAWSCKNKVENQEANEMITTYIEESISNPFYIGENWYKLIGQKGRVERKLFNISLKEYTL